MLLKTKKIFLKKKLLRQKKFVWKNNYENIFHLWCLNVPCLKVMVQKLFALAPTVLDLLTKIGLVGALTLSHCSHGSVLFKYCSHCLNLVLA